MVSAALILATDSMVPGALNQKRSFVPSPSELSISMRPPRSITAARTASDRVEGARRWAVGRCYEIGYDGPPG